jgi:predicted small secreted protein
VALVEEDAVDDALDGLVDRGVVEDDVGRLAAELEGQRLRVPAMARAIILPTSVEPVKAILSMPGWSTIACAGVAGAGDDVDDAGRQVGLLADLGEEQRGQRRGLGRLEDHGVAAGQRRGDLPREHQQREVPRDDLAATPSGRGSGPVTGVPELVGPAGVVEEVRRRQRDVDVARSP